MAIAATSLAHQIVNAPSGIGSFSSPITTVTGRLYAFTGSPGIQPFGNAHGVSWTQVTNGVAGTTFYFGVCTQGATDTFWIQSNNSDAMAALDEITGATTTGYMVQKAYSESYSATSTVSLSAFASPSNGLYLVGYGLASSWSAKAGINILASSTYQMTGWKASPDTTPSLTATSGYSFGYAFEIAADANASTPSGGVPNGMMLMGVGS